MYFNSNYTQTQAIKGYQRGSKKSSLSLYRLIAQVSGKLKYTIIVPSHLGLIFAFQLYFVNSVEVKSRRLYAENFTGTSKRSIL